MAGEDRAPVLLSDNVHGRTMSCLGIYGDCRRHLVLAVLCEQHLVVGDIPGLDTHHATPARTAKVGHGGCFLGPRVPDHGRGGTVLVDDDAAPPPSIFDDALRRGVEVDAVGLLGDGDEVGGLRLAPCIFFLVDVCSARML
jgi:hypothetical protein